MLIAEKKLDTDKCQLLPFEKANWRFSAESCLNVACENFSVLRNTLNKHGNNTLSEYLNYIKPKHQSSCQSIGDLLDVIKRYIQPLLGESKARQAADDEGTTPVAASPIGRDIDTAMIAAQSGCESEDSVIQQMQSR